MISFNCFIWRLFFTWYLDATKFPRTFPCQSVLSDFHSNQNNCSHGIPRFAVVCLSIKLELHLDSKLFAGLSHCIKLGQKLQRFFWMQIRNELLVSWTHFSFCSVHYLNCNALEALYHILHLAIIMEIFITFAQNIKQRRVQEECFWNCDWPLKDILTMTV